MSDPVTTIEDRVKALEASAKAEATTVWTKLDTLLHQVGYHAKNYGIAALSIVGTWAVYHNFLK